MDKHIFTLTVAAVPLLVIGPMILAAPQMSQAGTTSDHNRTTINDPNALTIVGNNVRNVQLSGTIHSYNIVMANSNGQSYDLFYLHTKVPINWYPAANETSGDGAELYPLFHVYDVQIYGRSGVMKSAKGGSRMVARANNNQCVTVVGIIHTNELHALSGIGPEPLGIEVEHVKPCRN